MTAYYNDGSNDSPKLQVYLNTDNLTELPDTSIWFNHQSRDLLANLKADGFAGFQAGEGFEVPDSPMLPFCGVARINHPEESDAIFERHKQRGDTCITLHVGWGIEDDKTIDNLIISILRASDLFELPAFIETHRATITQDMWRTVEITKEFPEIRFNGDFSHYYCGQEMVYGGLEKKLNFIQPILDRVAFLHGRISSSGCMQVPIDNESEKPGSALGTNYLEDFKHIWKRAMHGFKKNASTGDVLIFAPELLPPTIYYARVFQNQHGKWEEETDRYQQALLYKTIAETCFEQA